MKANDRQVAGVHYETPPDVPQHWDIVWMHNLDYFQAQITKYVMRWKKKHTTPEKRLEDLKKARHVLDKYIEEVEAGNIYNGIRPPAVVMKAPSVAYPDATAGYVDQDR